MILIVIEYIVVIKIEHYIITYIHKEHNGTLLSECYLIACFTYKQVPQNFVGGCVNVFGANDLTWSFILVNLQGKSGLFYSPSMKSSKQSHEMTAISTLVYTP
jgi:hypothetical protein